MPLDQTLVEIESILRDTEGTFQFSHPSFQKVLTARQFADEINSGKLSVRDAYVNFWSYEEDAELWNLPKDEWRSTLPAWHRILSGIKKQLLPQYAHAIEEIVMCSLKKHDGMFKNEFNPFGDDSFISDKESYSFGRPTDSLYDLPVRRCSVDKENEPTERDLMFIRPLDELIGIIRSSDSTVEAKRDAFLVLENKDIEPTEELLEIYHQLDESNSKIIRLKANILNMLLKAEMISPKEFAEDFFNMSKFLRRAIAEEDYYPLDSTSYRNILVVNGIPNQAVRGYLGNLIRNAWEQSPRRMKIFYMQCISCLRDIESGPLLMNLLDDYSEIELVRAKRRGYVVQVNLKALDTIGEIGYVEAAPLLHKRLKKRIVEFYSDKTRKLIRINNLEQGRHFSEEMEMYGEIFSIGITTTTSLKIDKIVYEINHLIKTLGKLNYHEVMPDIEEIIKKRSKYLVTGEIAEALGELGTSRAYRSLIKLHDHFVGGRLSLADDCTGFGMHIEKVVHTYEDFRHFVSTIRKSGSYQCFELCLDTLHNRFKPQGYNPPVKRLAA